MIKRHDRETATYLVEAKALRKAAETRQGAEREKLKGAARELEHFAKSISKPMIEWEVDVTRAVVDAGVIVRLHGVQPYALYGGFVYKFGRF